PRRPCVRMKKILLRNRNRPRRSGTLAAAGAARERTDDGVAAVAASPGPRPSPAAGRRAINVLGSWLKWQALSSDGPGVARKRRDAGGRRRPRAHVLARSIVTSQPTAFALLRAAGLATRTRAQTTRLSLSAVRAIRSASVSTSWTWPSRAMAS